MDEYNNIENIANDTSVFQPDQPQHDKRYNDNGTPIIKVIGVGGGGGNAVDHMYEENVEGVSFVVVNTDRSALLKSAIPEKVQLGPGLGAGGNPEMGRNLAEEDADKIAELFDNNTKMVFITAGMGGGTGTGAGPVVARIAREYGMLTIGIVTLPFMFEGKPQLRKAIAGAKEMEKYVDALLLINNERLLDIYGDLDFEDAFKKADDTLLIAAKSISDLINMTGETNVDFEDVKSALKDGKTAIISSGEGEGENRITKAIEAAINSPLLQNRDIQSSKRFMFNLYYNKLTTKEMKQMTKFMAEFSEDVKTKWGRTKDESLGNKVKITILAAGFDISVNKEVTYRPPTSDTPEESERKTADNNDTVTATAVADSEIENIYGSEKVSDTDLIRAQAKYRILDKDQMDNDALINYLEKYPTFKRGNNKAILDEWNRLVDGNSTKQDYRETKPSSVLESVKPADKPKDKPENTDKRQNRIEF